MIWPYDRPKIQVPIELHPFYFSGERWEDKVHKLIKNLMEYSMDAFVITSQTEINWLLNLRGSDYVYTPLFKSFVIVSKKTIYLYVNRAQMTNAIELHLQSTKYSVR